jgi:ADP-ribose pyrophosphatase YjhB (NUDIX family)
MSQVRVVPAVRLIVPDESGQVLLLQRAPGTQAGGAWCLPGGKVDYGQRVEEAAEAELREETSLCCEGVRFLFYQDSPPLESGGMHCVNLVFECRAVGEIALNRESSAWVRIGPEGLEDREIAFRGDEALRRYWAHPLV